MVSENPDAFGVFQCPRLYWARKIFNFVPCNLIKISTHDFIKAAIGLCSYSHLILTIVCSDMVLGPSRQASGYATLIYM